MKTRLTRLLCRSIVAMAISSRATLLVLAFACSALACAHIAEAEMESAHTAAGMSQMLSQMLSGSKWKILLAGSSRLP